MKKNFITILMVVATIIIAQNNVYAGGIPGAMIGQVLQGDQKLACEAVLCLASGVQPSECQPSLKRYFNIVKRTFSATFSARLNFLNSCPVVTQDPVMSDFLRTLTNGAGRCDATTLNNTMQAMNGDLRYVSNVLPEHCAAYSNHTYSNVANTMPKYVGTPERGGYWIEPNKYNEAFAEWRQRIQAEDAERVRQSLYGN